MLYQDYHLRNKAIMLFFAVPHALLQSGHFLLLCNQTTRLTIKLQRFVKIMVEGVLREPHNGLFF